MKYLPLLLIILACPLNALSFYSDAELVVRIADQLEESYDNKPIESLTDRIIHGISRKNYLAMLEQWKIHYRDLSAIEVEIPSFVRQIIRSLEKNVSPAEAMLFESRFKKLMLLTFENFQMYYQAVKDQGPRENLEKVTCDYIDSCLMNMKYYEIQLDLYARETVLTDSLRQMMDHPNVKFKLTLHRFGQDLLLRYRKKTIDRLLSKYREILN